tara:strand:+ start:685 stop:942 length:258 start_codon:yes stop_codon:yes gene_type:complete
LLLTFGLTISGTALADEGLETDAVKPAARYATETHLDFRELDVVAAVQRPDGAVVQVRRSADFAPMIHLRTNFNEELSESVELVK